MADDSDATRFLEAVARHHPDPDAFERASAVEADAGTRAETVCALMRLGASLGDRNGHTGVFPLDRHAVPLHFYPVRLYEFDDGVFVVSSANPALLGAEVRSIGGVEIASVLDQVEPLVPRDNHQTLRARRPGYVVAAEVLEGLGIGDAFVFDEVETRLESLPALEYATAVDADRRLPHRRRDERAWVERVDDGRIVLVAYNVTRGETASLAEKIAAMSRADQPRSLVLDLRLNNGGDNTTYGPLLAELERQAKTARLYVLTSRITFSAAMNLVVDLEQRTDAVFVGEATGASPNHFGDAVEIELPATGLVAKVATISWETAGRGDARLTREPDLRVPVTSSDFFAGRDPTLDAAVSAR